MTLIAPPRGIIKPPQWNFNPALVEPRWRWAWDAQPVLALPLWLGGGAPRATRSLINAGPSVSTGEWQPAERGISYDLDAADELRWADNAKDDLTTDTWLAMFVAIHRDTDFDATSGILVHRTGFSAGYHGLGTSLATLQYFLHDGSLSTVDSGVDVTSHRGYHSYGVVRAPGGVWTFVIDGIEVSGGTNTTIPGAGSHAFNVGHIRDTSTANEAPGQYLATYYWLGSPVLPSHLSQLHADPFGPFRPARRRRVFVAVAGGVFPVGLATETDTALGVGAAKDAAVGLASEADTGLSVGAAKARTAGLASETDAAFGLTVAKALAVALTVETDSALPVTASGAVDVGLASEADSALGVGSLKTVAVGLSTETDAALAVTQLTGTPVGLASETDAALAVAVAKALAVGLSEEADTALAATPVRTIVLGQASETDTALALSVLKSVTTGLAVETDQGLVVVASKAQSVGLATETDSAFGVLIVGAAVELTGPFKAAFTDPVRVAVWIDPVRAAQFTDPARKADWKETT